MSYCIGEGCTDPSHNTETPTAGASTQAVSQTDSGKAVTVAKDHKIEAAKVEEMILNKKLQFEMRMLKEDEKTYRFFDKKTGLVVELPHRCRVCLDPATHIEVAGGDQMCVLYYCPSHAMKNTSTLQRIQSAIKAKKQQEKNGDLHLSEVRESGDQGNTAEGEPGLPQREA